MYRSVYVPKLSGIEVDLNARTILIHMIFCTDFLYRRQHVQIWHPMNGIKFMQTQ